jgi:zinc transport system permease protein
MMQFFADLGDNPFLLRGLGAGLLASLACGVMGPFVVAKRIVFLAGAIAHIAIGGIGSVIYLRYRFPDLFGELSPIYGAAAVSVLAAVTLAVLHHRVREQLDTIVGALWALGMAVGILLVKITPGYQTELMSYLFGNLVYVSRDGLVLMIFLDLLIVGAVVLFYKRFFAICLDAEQASLQGVPVLATEIALMILVALTVIVLTQVVGLILVIALLSLPAATAGRLVTRLASLIWVSIGICAFLTTLPRIAVYGTAISPEPAIVLAAATLYLGAILIQRWVRSR